MDLKSPGCFRDQSPESLDRLPKRVESGGRGSPKGISETDVLDGVSQQTSPVDGREGTSPPLKGLECLRTTRRPPKGGGLLLIGGSIFRFLLILHSRSSTPDLSMTI